MNLGKTTTLLTTRLAQTIFIQNFLGQHTPFVQNSATVPIPTLDQIRIQNFGLANKAFRIQRGHFTISIHDLHRAQF